MVGSSSKGPTVCPVEHRGILPESEGLSLDPDPEQAEELLPSLNHPNQGWGISEGWEQGQPWRSLADYDFVLSASAQPLSG